ncbi:hypothetical protein BpHYR1_000226 [Brachionus plicatilis]|uniref:Uncharacterized protein n=1 Tax=Brachionus plicatilis TaxID=10195 RepID=A0A3M7QM71_BRAPC|nr:hypothetical protein BpHYR1_000226 [Brachionus plicatilis]
MAVIHKQTTSLIIKLIDHQDLNLKLTKETVDDYILTKQNLSWRTFNDYSQFCQINETNLCSDDCKQKNLLNTTSTFMFLALHTKRKRGRPKKQKAALFYQNDCDLSSSENESNPEQAVMTSKDVIVEQEPPSDSVIEKEYVTEATVKATVEATVDLPRKRGRPKKFFLSTNKCSIEITKYLQIFKY